MRVRFLATSSSIRSDVGGNRDVYLVTVRPAREPGPVAFARLIDNFIDYQSSIPERTLASARPAILRLRRDPSCDLPFEDMPLRTAPGDPGAILTLPLSFQPHLRVQPRPTQILPCYRTVRH